MVYLIAKYRSCGYKFCQQWIFKTEICEHWCFFKSNSALWMLLGILSDLEVSDCCTGLNHLIEMHKYELCGWDFRFSLVQHEFHSFEEYMSC
jgi:hypothetical protein